jgi:vitamin B12 transporter
MGSWATAYITPSLAQLYGAFGANPDLEAESNRTLEAGLELGLVSGLRISVLHFDRKEENTVLFDNADFLYFNSDTGVRVRGLEGELQWEWSPGSQLQFNYTFTEPEGENAIRIPKHKLNLLSRWQFTRKGGVTVSYSFTGERMDTDFSTFTPVTLEGFSLVDLRLDYDFHPGRFSAFLQVSNLLNESYTEVIGFSTPGRNVMLGGTLQL